MNTITIPLSKTVFTSKESDCHYILHDAVNTLYAGGGRNTVTFPRSISSYKFENSSSGVRFFCNITKETTMIKGVTDFYFNGPGSIHLDSLPNIGIPSSTVNQAARNALTNVKKSLDELEKLI